MLINHNVIKGLCNDAGETRTAKARAYQRSGRVKIVKIEYENYNNFEVLANVIGSERYHTYVQVKNGEVENITCDCQDYYNHYGVCKHSLATVLELAVENIGEEKKQNTSISENNTITDTEINMESTKRHPRLSDYIDKTPSQTQNQKDRKYRNFKQIVTAFYNEEVDGIDSEEETSLKNKGTINLEPLITYDKFSGDLKVEFKIGNKRMYKIKDLSEFYDHMRNQEFYRYGEKLQFIHSREMFTEESKPLLDFLLKYAEIIKYANSNSNSNYRYYGKALSETCILVSNSGLDELFDVLKGKSIAVKKDYTEVPTEFVEENPKIEFKLKKVNKEEYEILPNVEIFKTTILQGKNYKYVLTEDKFYRCSKEFEHSTLKLLEMFRQNYMSEVFLQKEDLVQLFSVIMPKIKNAIILDGVTEEEIEEYKPKELVVKLFLDFNENDYLVADVKFCYEENEFNPLNENEKLNFPRNMIQETKALNIFRKTGFMLDVKNLRFILPDNDKIYEFLTEDITYYMQKFEVMVTDNFKTKQITKPKMGAVGVKVENDLLKVDLSGLNFEKDELEEIMQKYQLKKKYHRLKNGSFIELQENDEIDFLDKLTTGMNVDYKQIEEGEIRLPVSRSLYLNQLLKGIKGTEIIKNQDYRKIVHDLNQESIDEERPLPQNLQADLRYYQKIGYQWLKILDSYHFGGILADDMGLGKTIQLLAIILDEKNKNESDPNKTKRASLVISPSSLTLNWQNEAKKFAPDLKVQVIQGTAAERKRKIENIEDFDLIVTSYDLLKRDIETYQQKDYVFRFAIADEAQYLKNSNTQNAKAIKKIRAETRYALTGTPIENSLAELWSIFDFIMPGYLFEYKQFKTVYETPIVKENNEKAIVKLKMLIEPFVLRRIKKEVLTELPEKTVTVLDNEMEPEQRNIYLTYLAQAKQEVAEEIQMNSFGKSQIKILAALTRLRQICCHPSLFLSNYQGGCSKLDQCLEIIQEAANGGHKLLLFSSYTSMFELIEPELKERKIKYFKLTGATKVDERIDLVDEFNENPEIKVFLISLKAGGTGLNLTGADMVIHYDPWWNLSAENQATDRAYRIGQRNNVQVYKLITKNSIEEKIYELQERKAELSENMLNTQTTFINKLSKEEIMKLFN